MAVNKRLSYFESSTVEKSPIIPTFGLYFKKHNRPMVQNPSQHRRSNSVDSCNSENTNENDKNIGISKESEIRRKGAVRQRRSKNFSKYMEEKIDEFNWRDSSINEKGLNNNLLSPYRTSKKTSTRKTRNRRSMSDPNLQKNFLAIKNLWDSKVMNDPVAPKIFTATYVRNSSPRPQEKKRIPSDSSQKKQNPGHPSRPRNEPRIKPFQKSTEVSSKPALSPRPKKQNPFNSVNDTSPKKDTNSNKESSSFVMSRAKMFETVSTKTEINNNETYKTQSSKNIRSGSEESIESLRESNYGSFKKVKPEDIASRFQNNYKKKAQKEEEEALLLNFQEDNESDDLIKRMSENANNARKKRTNSSKRSLFNNSDTDSTCSRSSMSSTEGPITNIPPRINEALTPTTNRSFLHSQPNSRKNSMTNNTEECLTKPRTSSLHKSQTFSNPSSPKNELTVIPQTRSAVSLQDIEASSPGAMSVSHLHRNSRSSSIDRVSSGHVTPVGCDSPPQRRNSALHRQMKKVNTNSPTIATSLSPRISTDSGTGSVSPDILRSQELIPISTTPEPTSQEEDKTSPLTQITIVKDSPKERPKTISAPVRPNRPAPPPPPIPTAKRESDPLLGQAAGTPDSVFNAEQEYSKIVKQIESEEDEKTKSSDTLVIPASKIADNDSEYVSSDDDDNGSDLQTSTAENNEAQSKEETLQTKLHNIAKELLSTEESYVEVLHLIDQVFHKQVTAAINKKSISTDIKNVFSNVSAIYSFHSGFLLPNLRERLSKWDTDARIGDIMKQAAPFLKMYSLYVQNFDEAMNLIKFWSDKSNNFKNIISDIQKLPECKSLSLQHHMLGPVQRIPRYKMLLEDYLRRLPEDSNDKTDASMALDLISKAATHSNETMRQMDKFQKLFSIYNSLDINLDLGVSRELIMEGKITKISARSGEKYERYLYLFSDMLLCCTPIKRIGKQYKVNANIELDGMEIVEVSNLNVPNTFCVHGLKKSMDFAASSPEEKQKWVSAITGAIDAFYQRSISFKREITGSGRRKKTSTGETTESPKSSVSTIPESTEPHHHLLLEIDDEDLGKRAPRWIKDNEVTLCMSCSKKFHQLVRRRHHCRACGRVICTECSDHKLDLHYDPGKLQKVCDRCFDKLTGKKKDEKDKKGILQVTADTMSENSILSEYLFFNDTDKKKGWLKRWCVIPNNLPCLYIYGAHQDVKAFMTLPLIGYATSDTQKQSMDREHCFKLSQATKTYLFSAESEPQKEKWKFVFDKCSKGVDITKDDVEQFNSQSNESIVSNCPIENHIYESIKTLPPDRPISIISESSTCSTNSNSTN